MSTKTTFKRIALVAVAALGLGVLSVVPAKAAGVPTTTLTLSATTASIAVNETATVTANIDLVSGGTTDSVAVFTTISKPTGSSQGLPELRATTDSSNVTQTNHLDFIKSQIVGYSDTITVNSSSLGVVSRASYQVNLVSADLAGTYTVNVIVSDAAKTSILASKSFTVTVAAKNLAPSTTYSVAQIVQSSATLGADPDGTADSSVVAAPGTLGANAIVASIRVRQYNSDSVATVTVSTVGESITATIISGPGTLKINGAGTAALSVTAKVGETITVLNDGRSGSTSIRLGSTSLGTSWVTKTVTFYGEMASFSAITLPTGSAINLADGGSVKVYPKDAASVAVASDTKHGVYLYSSDTKVVSNYGTSCTFSGVATLGYASCALTVVDSGTVTITVRDSATVATSAFSATSATLTIAGAAYKGTITSDKSTYVPGEAMKFTVTSTDVYGRQVANGASTPFGTTSFRGATPTFGSDASAAAAGGGSFTALQTYLNAGGSFVSGIDTLMAFAPSTPGTYILIGSNNGLTEQVLLTFTVADATKDAADAATDAALEATDAAYAAQDAAQLAAESADAATAAAEAATAAAEAATAAVEDLATKVAGLFADLQKQITTLANVVAKIAKKVKA